MITAMHCFVSGRVQGVSFRYYTYREATRLGIVGWVRNLTDGRVEVLACGNPDAMEQLKQWLHHGPPAAQVDNVDCQATKITTTFTEFKIT